MCGISEIDREFSEQMRDCGPLAGRLAFHFGRARYYWRIAVAKPVSQCRSLGRVAGEIIPVIKPTSRRPGDEGTAFIGFMGTCILLV